MLRKFQRAKWRWMNVEPTSLEITFTTFARIVTGSRKFDHITPLLKQLCCLPVNVSLHSRDIILAYKCLNGYAPEYLTERFIARSQIHDRATRKKDSWNVPLYRTAAGQRSFFFSAVKPWNDLPDYIKSENNLRNIKQFLRTYLFKQLYSDS